MNSLEGEKNKLNGPSMLLLWLVVEDISTFGLDTSRKTTVCTVTANFPRAYVVVIEFYLQFLMHERNQSVLQTHWIVEVDITRQVVHHSLCSKEETIARFGVIGGL